MTGPALLFLNGLRTFVCVSNVLFIFISPRPRTRITRAATRAFLEVRTLWYVAYPLVNIAFFHEYSTWLKVMVSICVPLNIWYASQIKDDDDRWKRRRAKLAAKVQVRSGKLVVVPVGSSS